MSTSDVLVADYAENGHLAGARHEKVRLLRATGVTRQGLAPRNWPKSHGVRDRVFRYAALPYRQGRADVGVNKTCKQSHKLWVMEERPDVPDSTDSLWG